MVPINRRKVSLYEEAKNGLSSLVWQTATVFVGFIFMLLLTGGNPSSFAITLSFILGIAFVAWREQLRVTKLRDADSNDLLGKRKRSTKYNLLKGQKIGGKVVQVDSSTIRSNTSMNQLIGRLGNKLVQVKSLESFVLYEESIDKKSNIESLLSELQESIMIDSNLTDDEKADAVEHLKAINQLTLKRQSTKPQISQAKTLES
jgi:hypothetical protein